MALFNSLVLLVTSCAIATTRVESGSCLIQLSRSWGKPNRYQTDSLFTLIHVGKCAGGTVNKFLEHNNVSVDRIHASVPDPAKLDAGIVVVLRDPIDRLVSAFNWRHPSTRPAEGRNLPHTDHDESELAFYRCFDSVNEFAEALDADSKCGQRARDALTQHTKHIGMGYEFYFPDSVMAVMRTHRVFIIHQERLEEDLHNFLKWNNIPQTHDRIPHSHSEDHTIYPKKDDTYLSKEGRNKLRAHLARDYEIYKELDQMSVDISGTQSLRSALPHL